MDLIYEKSGFRLSVLETGDPEMKAYLELRTSVWNKEGWENVPEGEFELDSFDSSATYAVITHKGLVVAGFRLIYAKSPLELPFAKHCDDNKKGRLRQSKAGVTLEISRWCTDQAFSAKVRAMAHKVMIDGIIILLSSRRISTAYMDVCDFLFAHFTKIGGALSQLGGLHRRPDGSGFIPTALDVEETARNFGLLENLRACA